MKFQLAITQNTGRRFCFWIVNEHPRYAKRRAPLFFPPFFFSFTYAITTDPEKYMFRCCDGAEFLSQFHVLEVNNIGLVRRKSLSDVGTDGSLKLFFVTIFFYLFPQLSSHFSNRAHFQNHEVENISTGISSVKKRSE